MTAGNNALSPKQFVSTSHNKDRHRVYLITAGNFILDGVHCVKYDFPSRTELCDMRRKKQMTTRTRKYDKP